jgi:hypothetical protein
MKKDVAADRDASYRNAEFFISFAGGFTGVRPVHLQRFRKRDA